MRLSEKGQEYENQTHLMQDFLDDGYNKKDIIAGINYCAELEAMDEGDDTVKNITKEMHKEYVKGKDGVK